MAGIGDYIHLRNQNYQRHGTFYNEGSNYSEALYMFREQREMALRNIYSNINRGKTAELQDFLQNVLYGGEDSPQKDEAWRQYSEKIEKILQETYQNFDFNMQGLYANQRRSFHQIKEDQKKMSISTLKQKFKAIETMVNNSSLLNEKKMDLQSLITIRDELKQFLEENAARKTIDFSTDVGYNIKKNINLALAAQSFPLSNAIGEVGEYFFVLVALYLQNNKVEKVTDEVIQDFINTIKVGNARSNVVISGKNFNDEYVDVSQLVDSSFQQINDTMDFQTKLSSQDKMDINFQWKDESVFQISMKNYSFRDTNQAVHILSGSSLLYMIQNENDTMVNHWLNLISTSDKDTISDSSSLIATAHETMKTILLIKGLTGQGLGRKNLADTFVINMRAQKRILVFTMDSLVRQLLIGVNGKGFDSIDFKGYPDSGLSHEMIGTELSEQLARARITALLKSVAGCKISITIPGHFFYNLNYS